MSDMNLTPARSTLTPQLWDKEFFNEYVRENQFANMMGASMTSLIQVKDDLTRKNGDTVTFAAVRKLVGAGVVNNQILEGNEELLDARALAVKVTLFRHGVAVSDWDEQLSAIDIRQAARDALKIWMMEKMRNDIIGALQSIDGVLFSSATTANANAWVTNNSDRTLFGNLRGNNTGVLTTSLANVNQGYPAGAGVNAGNLSAGVVSLAKRIAKNAHPGIRPIKLKNGFEYFVMFANSFSFRDLVNDPVIVQSRSFAGPRSFADNPLFQDGDVLWDGVIVKEIPEFGTLTGVGAAGINVGINTLCGAQAIGMAWARRTKTFDNVRDFGFQHGVGIGEIRGISKLRFGTDPNNELGLLKDNGIVTVFSAAPADA